MNDSIADMITRIKNAGDVGKKFAVVPYSKIKLSIAELLVKEGFIKAISKKGKKENKFIELELMFEGNQPKVKGVKRVSKFSRRVYIKSKDIKPQRSFSGKTIITTPKGIMTETDAKKEKLGGEVLFKIW